MPKRSRSRSKDRERGDRKTSKQLKAMQEQIDNLTKSMKEFIQAQKREITPTDVIESHKENITETSEDCDKSPNEDSQTDIDIISSEELLEIMGEELPSTSTTRIDDTIQKHWTQWMTKGLTEEARKELLKKYNREETFRTEAPKINLEIVSHLTEIAKKRDKHFTDTQNCVGTCLISLGAAISMLIENPEDGIDHTQLMKYLWDSGKVLTDIFHQHSVARKSFITPNLDKDIKSTLEATDSDEWLYGVKLNEQVKDAKNIKKASASLKAPEKPLPKKTFNQANWRGPPAKARQVGYFHQRQFTNVRYRPKPFQTKSSQNPGRPMTQRQNRPTSKK